MPATRVHITCCFGFASALSLGLMASAQAQAPNASPMQACVDAAGRTTLTDRACPPDTVASTRAPGHLAPEQRAPKRPALSQRQRALWAAQAQVALEAAWQKEVEVRPDSRGLTVHNRTRRDVYWFIAPDEPVAWIPLSLNNRIPPGTT